MLISPVVPILPVRSNVAPSAWTVVEHRVVVIDGVPVQYEYAYHSSRDADGNRQQNTSVSMVWAHGMKVMDTDGFERGMSDAALVHKLRGVLFSLTTTGRLTP